MHIFLFILLFLYIVVCYGTALLLHSISSAFSKPDRLDKVIETVTLVLAPLAVPIVVIYNAIYITIVSFNVGN